MFFSPCQGLEFVGCYGVSCSLTYLGIFFIPGSCVTDACGSSSTLCMLSMVKINTSVRPVHKLLFVMLLV